MGLSSLRTSSDFDRVFAERQRHFKNGLTIYFRRSGTCDFRYGIVTPKRFGKSVLRNKFRRRVREIIRTSDTLPKGLEIIVCVNKPLKDFTFALVRESLSWSLSHPPKGRARDCGVSAKRQTL
ncbi:MAG: hypothetical protein ACD_74C00134G0001 [uncultured bacterium]|nr:MAG: hypothetical protein ACD_74C00134G0001 [uncultured bacterium]